MDVKVIKKNSNEKKKKNIGRIFKEHNIFEYKSEKDSFSRWDYNKIVGYAFLYSSFEQIPISEITLSVSLTMYPRELIKHLTDERELTVQNLCDGIYYIEGDIVPIQILENKRLSSNDNLFLRNLRSNLSATDMMNTLKHYKERKPLDDKNVYLDRLIKANHGTFMEVMNVTEGVKEIFLEGAERYGWLNDRDSIKLNEEKKKIAKEFLLLDISVEKVAKATKLPLETVMGLV
jgi:hypothetical protein